MSAVGPITSGCLSQMVIDGMNERIAGVRGQKWDIVPSLQSRWLLLRSTQYFRKITDHHVFGSLVSPRQEVHGQAVKPSGSMATCWVGFEYRLCIQVMAGLQTLVLCASVSSSVKWG